VPEGWHYAIFSVGVPSWHNYTLGSCLDAATHSSSISVGWYFYPFQGILGDDGHPCTRIVLGLLVVNPDVAKPLAFVSLCEASMVIHTVTSSLREEMIRQG
jgi:hypothetical protein